MNAREMFEELGYEFQNEDENEIVYVDKVFILTISKQMDAYNHALRNNIDTFCGIPFELHQAIHQQMKELGWIDE